MDKLEPIIKNRFWILAGLLLPIAMYGFFSANSKLKAATESRETALKGVLSGIPGGTNDPNEKYSKGLEEINDVYSANVDRSVSSIWQNQQQRMTWPSEVKKYVPDEFLSEFPYAGSSAYKRVYERSMRKLQSRVQPVMPLVRGEDDAVVPPNQKVILAASIPQSKFGRFRATSEQIWDAQIDIWLLSLLFDAVARLNEDKDSATEAVLRRIDELRLVGGDGTPVLTGGASKGGKGYGGGDEGMGMRMSGGSGEGGGGGGYGGGGGSRTKTAGKAVNIAFNPAQEFGSDKDTGGDSDDADTTSTPGYGSGRGASGKILRYIADTDENPFLERGFYMSVIIMQDKVPDFLVELASSDWPIRVTRFHVGKNPYYSLATGVRGGGEGFNFGAEMEGRGGSFETSDAPGPGGGAAGSFGGVGGRNTAGIPGVGGLDKNLPEFADAAMQNSNLVQLDLCGVITMYKQPPSIVEALGKDDSANSGNKNPETESSGDEPSEETEVPADGTPVDAETVPAAELPATETPAEPEGEAVPDSTEK